MSFDVPTLPLFIHERLSTKAILETLKGHRRDRNLTLFDLFADREHPIHDQVLRAYEHQNGWVNRLILGDSLTIMNSLLHFESLGGQVQTIYMDPPYGIKFGSNFQPFVRKRDVTHNDDEDMTREPEMVKAYRDTWELGRHSYLTYLRDRLLLARELLTDSGSIFVQISDDNLHYVREVMDEIFHAENFMAVISYRVKSPIGVSFLGRTNDFIIWYARDKKHVRYNQLYVEKSPDTNEEFSCVQLPDGSRLSVTEAIRQFKKAPDGSRYFTAQNLASSGRTESCIYDYKIGGRTYSSPRGKEVGGIVPHITLESIANDEPSREEVLVDRPEVNRKITRVTGPFSMEATIPTPLEWEGNGTEDSPTRTATESHGAYLDRLLEAA